MGNLWILIVAPVAILGAWLFFSTYEQQRSDQHVIQVEHARDKAEFDRDFSKAWSGGESQELSQRASDANATLTKALSEKEKADAARLAQREKEQAQLGALLGSSSADASKGQK